MRNKTITNLSITYCKWIQKVWIWPKIGTSSSRKLRHLLRKKYDVWVWTMGWGSREQLSDPKKIILCFPWQRWANSVLMTEYEYEYYLASQKGLNMNTNIIRLLKITEYEYEYYSVSRKWPNTNTNIIRLPKKDRIRIRILFGFTKKDRIRILFGSPKIHSEEK